MDWSGQLGFTLDVYDTGLAHRGADGDARGTTERVFTEVIDRKSVDLANHAALDGYHQSVVVDHLLNLVFNQVHPGATATDSGENIRSRRP